MRRPIRWAGAYALLASIVAVVFAGGILLGPYRAVERSDYMTYHMAARIVLQGNGSCLYDEPCQAEGQRELIGEEPSFANGALPFNSPPWLAALVAPLGALPLPAGFVVFVLLSLAVLAWGTWRVATHAGLSGIGARLLAVVLLLTDWPTVMGVIRGQSTLIVVGLLALSVGLPRYRSGLAMGLALLKPTLPPLWATWQLLGGHWRAVGTAAATALGLVAVSVVIASPQALVDYPAHLVGVAGADSLGVHPAEMVNWRGAAERLGMGTWFIVVGSLATLGLMAVVWLRTSSRQLGAAAAFLATPLVLPHANQHEFILASAGILLAVLAAGSLRSRLAAAAIGIHAVLWSGPILAPQAAAWLLFVIMLGWLAVVAALAWREKRPLSEG